MEPTISRRGAISPFVVMDIMRAANDRRVINEIRLQALKVSLNVKYRCIKLGGSVILCLWLKWGVVDMWEFIIEAILFVISVGLGFTIAYFMPSQDTVLLGTLLSLAFYSVGQYLKFVKSFIDINHTVADMGGRLSSIETRSGLRSSIIENVTAAFEINDPLIREAVLHGIRDFSQAITKTDHGVILKGDKLALDTYESFWILLINKQKQGRLEGLQPMVVRVTHSTSINIWKSRRSNPLLELQRRFVEEGGKIVRVLIRPGERKESLADYKETTELMRKFDISTFALEIDFESEMTYDYLLVERLNYIFRWDSDVIGRNIDGCQIYRSEEQYSRFIGDWRAVIAALEKQKLLNPTGDEWKYEHSPKAWELLKPSNG